MKTRATRKTKRRVVKPAKKTIRRKVKIDIKESASASAKKNKSAHWSTFRDLEKKAEKAMAKFRSNIKKKASPATLLKDKSELLLLLGECNYMARQCMRAASIEKKGSKKRS